MITRRVFLWCSGGAILVVAGLNAASWIERLQMSADSANALVRRETNRAEGAAKQLSSSARKLPQINPDKLTQEGWERTAARFQEIGLPKAEAESLISAVKDQLPAKQTGQEAYSVPAYVRKGWVKGEEVWVLGFGWGMRDMGPRPESPGHYLVMVLQSKMPYKVLGSARCK